MKGSVPILGFSAWSGTGKTTLLRQLIPALKSRGLRVSVIKHAHHHFDLDIPGKDSYELRKAGAHQTVICTTTRMAQITEFDKPEEEPGLQQIIASLDADSIDMILVEGYKDIHFPKIELHRHSLGKPYLHSSDDSVIAVACDADLPADCRLPALDINDIEAIANFIYDDFYRHHEKAPATRPAD